MINAFACLLKKGVFEKPLFFRGAGARGGSITGDLGFARRNMNQRYARYSCISVLQHAVETKDTVTICGKI
jgi:hypothetical protein